MIRPKFLSAGNKIGIVAPGRKVSREDMNTALQIFSNWGLKVQLSPNLYANQHSYLAASDESRLSDFQDMINDPDIAAIICARGGYGTTRILDKLDLRPLSVSPKWIVGFSDITALHLKLNVMRIQSIHATMPILFSKEDSLASVNSLRETLFGTTSVMNCDSNNNNRHGSATAEVIGGNLSMLVDSLSTSGDADFAEKILIVEEVDEYFYRIDRMFTHLLRAGKLAGLRGLVVGHFSDLKDTTPGFGQTVEEIILDKVGHFGYPVAFDFPSGHVNPNFAWISGSTMTLNVDAAGSSLTPLSA